MFSDQICSSLSSLSGQDSRLPHSPVDSQGSATVESHRFLGVTPLAGLGAVIPQSSRPTPQFLRGYPTSTKHPTGLRCSPEKKTDQGRFQAPSRRLPFGEFLGFGSLSSDLHREMWPFILFGSDPSWILWFRLIMGQELAWELRRQRALEVWWDPGGSGRLSFEVIEKGHKTMCCVEHCFILPRCFQQVHGRD